MKIWHEIQKIDASGGAKTATIPAGTITHSAYTVTAGKKITVTINGDTSILDIGESLVAEQIMGPHATLGTWPEVDVLFESGSYGTVSYAADTNLGPIAVV